jgi:hypothetical protein
MIDYIDVLSNKPCKISEEQMKLLRNACNEHFRKEEPEESEESGEVLLLHCLKSRESKSVFSYKIEEKDE